MPSKRAAAKRAGSTKRAVLPAAVRDQHELVIITGMSGAGKVSALKTFEDLGFYAVDNLPVGLISNFADLVRDSTADPAILAQLVENHRAVSRS